MRISECWVLEHRGRLRTLIRQGVSKTKRETRNVVSQAKFNFIVPTLWCWSPMGLAEHHQSYSNFELRCPRVHRWIQVSHLLYWMPVWSPEIDRPRTRRYSTHLSAQAPTFTLPRPYVDTKPVTQDETQTPTLIFPRSHLSLLPPGHHQLAQPPLPGSRMAAPGLVTCFVPSIRTNDYFCQFFL